MGSRRRAREFALQMLYQWDVTGNKSADVLKIFWVNIPFAADEQVYAERLFLGVTREVRSLDQTIESHSHKWRVSRMPPVDRNVLRLGTYELLHVDDVPVSVSINEAIELGKHYSTTESGAFINGILDKVGQALPATLVKRKSDMAQQTHEDGQFLPDDEDP